MVLGVLELGDLMLLWWALGSGQSFAPGRGILEEVKLEMTHELELLVGQVLLSVVQGRTEGKGRHKEAAGRSVSEWWEVVDVWRVVVLGRTAAEGPALGWESASR